MLGTDTGVGKTFIGCKIIEALHGLGYFVRVRKPVETGCSVQQAGLFPADAAALWTAAHRIDPLDTVCPLRFRAPLAAPEAARHEGRRLRFAQDIAPHLPAQATLLAARTEAPDTRWLIESAGGLMSPLAEDALGLDLAQYTGFPVILIAPDRLGTLSGLFAALEAIDRRRIPIAAIVLNRRPEDNPRDGEISPDNLAHIQRWLPEILTDRSIPPVLTQDTFDRQIPTVLASAPPPPENR